MNDVFYQIHTKSNGTIAVEFNLSQPNNLTRGEAASFEFHLPNDNKDLIVSGSETIAAGELAIYSTVTVESGATLTVDGTLQAKGIDNNGTIDNNGLIRLLTEDEIKTLRQYDDYGGGYSTVETLTSEIKYRDQLPSDANVASQAIGIEPSPKLKDKGVTGVWALVNSVDDTRPLALSDERAGVETTVIAEYSEFNDHTELENKLQI